MLRGKNSQPVEFLLFSLKKNVQRLNVVIIPVLCAHRCMYIPGNFFSAWNYSTSQKPSRLTVNHALLVKRIHFSPVPRYMESSDLSLLLNILLNSFSGLYYPTFFL